ncbi:hypothetical protein TIFTF001_004653 [Ficus carica]|uniref:Uncharacterized protein n=1 Tax=Ficus carica TaxID=3494 RepID=A0AA88CTI5_FICCA|nr:hypothetical protein TIFTF001_004653 [Ficus carica]
MPLLDFYPWPLQSRGSAIVRDRDRHRAAIADVAAINVAVRCAYSKSPNVLLVKPILRGQNDSLMDYKFGSFPEEA